MGRICPGFAARVVDEDDNEVPSGRGAVRLREGLFRYAGKTVEAWRNLWFRSDDRVVRDVDGRFRFVDRLNYVIRRRGENISSFEVEQVLLSHPEIASAAAYTVVSDLAEDDGGLSPQARELRWRGRHPALLRTAAALFRGAALHRS
jgi:crotonobetaine/carnitine-CoA ligase